MNIVMYIDNNSTICIIENPGSDEGQEVRISNKDWESKEKRSRVVLSDDEVIEDDSSKHGRKLSEEEVQEKASGEKGSDEVSTVGAKKGTASEEAPIVSTAEVNISTAGQ
ncbi:hypothetical protein Tco_0326194, partial [Tanacetum coccineum]